MQSELSRTTQCEERIVDIPGQASPREQDSQAYRSVGLALPGLSRALEHGPQSKTIRTLNLRLNSFHGNLNIGVGLKQFLSFILGLAARAGNAAAKHLARVACQDANSEPKKTPRCS